jgi:hypothetical protein
MTNGRPQPLKPRARVFVCVCVACVRFVCVLFKCFVCVFCVSVGVSVVFVCACVCDEVCLTYIRSWQQCVALTRVLYFNNLRKCLCCET